MQHIAVKLLADFVARSGPQVSIEAQDPSLPSDERIVLRMAGPVDKVKAWLSNGPALPASSRAYVTGSSVTLGLRFRKNRVEVEAEEFALPNIVAALNSIVGETTTQAGLPFAWTSLQLNLDTIADWHADKGNIGPSIIGVLGEHSGGEFHLAGSPPMSLQDHLLFFDGQVHHRSLPFVGRRFSFVAFRHPGLPACDPSERGRLKALGFNLGGPETAVCPTRVALDETKLWDPSFLYIGRGCQRRKLASSEKLPTLSRSRSTEEMRPSPSSSSSC